MSQMTDYLENKIVDHVFRATSYASPTGLHVSLHTANPTDTGSVGEVSTAGTGYSRAPLAPSVSNWASTNGATAGASTGTGGATSNKGTITFPTPTATWGTVTHFAIWDAATGGNALLYGTLNVSKTINTGDTVSFAPDSVTVTFA